MVLVIQILDIKVPKLIFKRMLLPFAFYFSKGVVRSSLSNSFPPSSSTSWYPGTLENTQPPILMAWSCAWLLKTSSSFFVLQCPTVWQTEGRIRQTNLNFYYTLLKTFCCKWDLKKFNLLMCSSSFSGLWPHSFLNTCFCTF